MGRGEIKVINRRISGESAKLLLPPGCSGGRRGDGGDEKERQIVRVFGARGDWFADPRQAGTVTSEEEEKERAISNSSSIRRAVAPP